MRIVADDKIPFLKGILEPFADVDYIPGGKITNDLVNMINPEFNLGRR